MSLTIKNLENKKLNISIHTYIDDKQNVWFKGKDVASCLGYSNTEKAIRMHVDNEDKLEIRSRPKWTTLKSLHPQTILINESGLYSLIFRSQLESAKTFKRWVTSDVLPSIRKYGHYRMFNNPKSLAFKIEDEYDLHTKVVQFIRRFYPEILMTAGVGENQDTKEKRINSFKKGYMKGRPDLIIQNLHKHYNGLCREFKTPQCNGVIMQQQKELIEKYEDNGFRCIISNDYDLITKEINDHMHDIRIKCKYCKRKFKCRETLKRHEEYFHRIK